jgi:hypothetical protein
MQTVIKKRMLCQKFNLPLVFTKAGMTELATEVVCPPVEHTEQWPSLVARRRICLATKLN